MSEACACGCQHIVRLLHVHRARPRRRRMLHQRRVRLIRDFLKMTSRFFDFFNVTGRAVDQTCKYYFSDLEHGAILLRGFKFFIKSVSASSKNVVWFPSLLSHHWRSGQKIIYISNWFKQYLFLCI